MNATAALNDGSTTPVWLLDIDGVVNSFGEPKSHMVKSFGAYNRVNIGPCDDGEIYPIWYSPVVVDFINRINREGLAEVVWLTTWMDEAVARFAPHVGLDTFPAITDMSGNERCWELDWRKWRRVRNFLGDNEPQRRVVWTDDDLSKQVREAFRCRYDPDRSISHLLTVQGMPGLRPKDVRCHRVFPEGLMPGHIQRQRVKSGRMPAGVQYAGPPDLSGNPFTVGRSHTLRRGIPRALPKGHHGIEINA